MQWRAGGLVVVVALVVIGGLAGPVASTHAFDSPSAQASTTETQASTAELCGDGPPDPESDVIGWEAGCWHNQSIGVDQSDGLNDSERQATVARAMARVEIIRQLEFERSVPVEIMSREEFRESRANDTVDPVLATFDNAKFEALFLIGEDEDSIAVQNENSGVNILGFYSPQREAIVLVSEDPSTPTVDEGTLVHELTHALQDQHFNLSRYDARTRDGANAESGLIEGDASLVEYRFDQRCQDDGPWNGSCLAPPSDGGSGGSLANIGVYFVKFQPYSDGPSFIMSLYRAGGWDAVDAAYDDPPVSSTQIIHPERYPEATPREVTLEDRQSDGWERVRPPNRSDYGEVGEAALTSMLVFPLYQQDRPGFIIEPDEWLNQTADGELSTFDPLHYDNRYAAGWNGDRLHVYGNEANETAYVWRLAWDTPTDAQEFVDGYTQVLEYWGGERVEPGLWIIEDGGFADAFHLQVEGDTLTIVNAPSIEELNAVRADTRTTPTPDPDPSPTPTTSPTAASPTSSPGQPGFGPVLAIAGLASALLWWRRH